MSARYQLEGLIARGGMAEVHLARSVGEAGFTKLLALKRILDTYAGEAQLKAMFMDEANLAARLSHPNIVQVFDFGRDEQGYFIAMEYVPGPDLANVLRALHEGGERPPEAAMIDVLIQVLRGLDHAHRLKGPDGALLNVIHRDVSPGNVLLTSEGVAKLSDFGVARATERLAENTKAGKTKGKSAYMSPEQARSRPLDARSDIFAAGLLLWEALSGQRCYQAPDEASLIRLAALGEIRKLTSVGIEVDAPLQAVVDRALQLDPAKRFPTASAMAEELEAYHRAAYPRYNAAALGAVVQRAVQLLPPLPHTRLATSDQPRTSPELAAGFRAPPRPAPVEAAPDEPPPGSTHERVEDAATSSLQAESKPAPAPVRRPRAQGSAAEEARVEASILPGERAQRRPDAPVDGKSETRSDSSAAAAPPAPAASNGTSIIKLLAVAVAMAMLVLGGFALLDRRAPEPVEHVDLGPLPVAPPPGTPVQLTATPTPPTKAAVPTKPAATVAEVAPSTPRTGTSHAKGTGFLSVKCDPWCDIHIDGKPSQHRSPADHIPLPAGTHSLRLVNPTVNLEKKTTVVIRADENLVRYFNLVMDR